MQSFRTIVALAVVASLAISFAETAPTETDASTTPMTSEVTNDAKTDLPTSTARQDAMAVSSAQDQTHPFNSTFSCYKREIGYYADLETKCKVYHFCSPGEFNGEIAYQRISYLCLNETQFDQQSLDCIAEEKMAAPCADSEKHYAESNKILRQAVVQQMVQETTSTTSTPEASSSTAATSTEAASTEGSTTTTTTQATDAAKVNEVK